MSEDMVFNKIKDGVRALGFEVLRADNDGYFEAVFIKDGLAKLNERLKQFLGEPVFPSEDKLTLQIEEAIKGFGGIQQGQTLFFQIEGANFTFAMLWPWSDGLHTTIKLIHK
jgi:hypothetical protein